MVDVLKPKEQNFKSIDDVLKSEKKSIKKPRKLKMKIGNREINIGLNWFLNLPCRMFDNS